MSVKKYLHQKVTLLSTSDVRYEGDLYSVDPSEQSIALKHVNCMGTEGRRTGDQAIAPSDCTYEFIIFRAVNIRELWLEDGQRQVDLTDEVLVPLRGQNASATKQAPEDAPGPKRKVGYQSRGGLQAPAQAQGYVDPYQTQAQPYGYDAAYGAYGQGASAYDERGAYAAAATTQQGGYYAAPQSYYDTPNQAYYGGGGQGGGGYAQRGYQQRGYQQRAGYDRGYQQDGYQKQRAAQYYNQGRSQYYNQGYGGQQQQQYYERRPQQYNNRRYQQGGYGGGGYNQGYNRGAPQQRQQQQRRGGADGRAGTGAFLDTRKLRGDEIDIKDAQDFDFGAAKSEFDHLKEPLNGYVNAEDLEAEQAAKTAAHAKAAAAAAQAAAASSEDTKADEDNKKYDRNISFFDGLQTETKRSKPKQDMQTQKDVDSETFGSVAVSYKSRHVNPQGGYYRSQGQQQQRRSYNSYNSYYGRPQQQPQQQQQQRYSQRSQSQSSYYRQQPQQQYQTNKWVVRR